MESYLKDRNQFVKLNNAVTSEKLKVKTGTPQGSSLGGTLFSIYINDLTYQDLLEDLQSYAEKMEK